MLERDYLKDIKPETKINFDTNGYMTEESLERIRDCSACTLNQACEIKKYTPKIVM
jgi:hypothetical protein